MIRRIVESASAYLNDENFLNDNAGLPLQDLDLNDDAMLVAGRRIKETGTTGSISTLVDNQNEYEVSPKLVVDGGCASSAEIDQTDLDSKPPPPVKKVAFQNGLSEQDNAMETSKTTNGHENISHKPLNILRPRIVDEGTNDESNGDCSTTVSSMPKRYDFSELFPKRPGLVQSSRRGVTESGCSGDVGGVACGDDGGGVACGDDDGGVACGDDGGGVACGDDGGGVACGDDDGGGVGWGSTPRIVDSETEVSSISMKKSGKSAACTQADPVMMEMEGKIIPFVRNCDLVEYRINGKLSQNQKAAVKALAEEHDLIHRAFGKGRDRSVALRKKARFHQTQILQKEFKAEQERAQRAKELQEAEKKAAAEAEAAAAALAGPQAMCIQADFDAEEKGLSEDWAGVIHGTPRNQPISRPLKVESSMQTCPEGYYVCLYCEKDLPEEVQAQHYPVCLADYRFKRLTEARAAAANRKPGTGPKKSKKVKAEERARSRSVSRHRSKSRNGLQMDDPKQLLEKFHDNDLDTLVKVVQRLDVHCAASGCKTRGKACDKCHRSFCSRHNHGHGCYPDPNVVKGGALWRPPPQETGLMFKRRRPQRPTNGGENGEPVATPSQQQLMGPPGPLTKFERDQLKKNLREKLSIMVEKRK